MIDRSPRLAASFMNWVPVVVLPTPVGPLMMVTVERSMPPRRRESSAGTPDETDSATNSRGRMAGDSSGKTWIPSPSIFMLWRPVSTPEPRNFGTSTTRPRSANESSMVPSLMNWRSSSGTDSVSSDANSTVAPSSFRKFMNESTCFRNW